MSRISVDEAARLWHDAGDDELRALAQAVRARWHEPDRATYMVMRIINYTNVCVAQCDYCAFYVLPNQDGGYVLDRATRSSRRSTSCSSSAATSSPSTAASTRSCRSTTTATCSPSVRERYGDRVEFYALTIAEFVFLADRAKLSLRRGGRAAARRRRALDHRRRERDPHRGLPQAAREVQVHGRDYFEAQRAIVESGHADDGDDGDRLRRDARRAAGAPAAHARLPGRVPRDGLGGLFSFLCWTYKPYGTAFGGREISPREYWRHIALSRIFLDNVKHVRTSVLTQNEDAFRALDYGADDFDLPIEDEVTQKAGARIDLDLEGLLAIPRRLGYASSTAVRHDRRRPRGPRDARDASIEPARAVRRHEHATRERSSAPTWSSLARRRRAISRKCRGPRARAARTVAELLEVAREEAGRVAVAVARLVREPLGLGAREPDRGDERLLELGEPFDDGLGCGPDGEDHRQARALEPEAAEVVVRRRVLERAAERRVADQELRVGSARRAGRDLRVAGGGHA